MIVSMKDYKEKVLGCWMGKNIGGTLGAPFECKRGVFDVDFYTQESNLAYAVILLQVAIIYNTNLQFLEILDNHLNCRHTSPYPKSLNHIFSFEKLKLC